MNQTVEIRDRTVGLDQPTYIIAEAGSNHDQDLDQAYSLIDAAADAGADAVKFQVFTADRIAARTDNPVAQVDVAGAQTLHQLYNECELPREWIPELVQHARTRGIEFLATPFDEWAADLLAKHDLPAFKIASFELIHHPLLRHVARHGRPIILSTGMAYLHEVAQAVETCRGEGLDEIVLLHCTSIYPTPPEKVNLSCLETLEQAFRLPVGYSDHTEGIEIPIAVAARGGSVVEKHFTLNRNLPGPDHGFALEPDELARMVDAIRSVERAKGDGRKAPAPEEEEARNQGRRSLFARREIAAGNPVTREDVAILRPGTGISPADLEKVLGRRVREDVGPHEPITWDKLG